MDNEITADQRAILGRRIAAAREAKGLTQEEVARGMGPDGRDLDKRSVSAWENGASCPSALQLKLLRNRLGVSADDLLGMSEGA